MDFFSDYNTELTIVYKGETYSVRDNGAVMRHPRPNGRYRRTDDIWTFGAVNKRTGYLEIASVRVHRIVAYAFHGEPPSSGHVVDHIDTNRQNNRPENLRWVTRLENILLNPASVKRIEIVCGCSIEEFLKTPSKYRHLFKEPNLEWMKRVSTAEANNCLENFTSWAEADGKTKGGTLSDWIYNRIKQPPTIRKPSVFTESLTPNVIQKNWKTPTEFPLCPQDCDRDFILKYAENLTVGDVFAKNKYTDSTIDRFTIIDNSTLLIICKILNGVTPWSVAKVTSLNGKYIHESIGSYFEENIAEKYYTLAQGLEWNGDDSKDIS